jgi:hypothetical protein
MLSGVTPKLAMALRIRRLAISKTPARTSAGAPVGASDDAKSTARNDLFTSSKFQR